MININNMKRTLIAQGKGGLTAYLPKAWIDSKGLKAGNSVDISDVDGRLIIQSEKKEVKEVTLYLNNDNKHDVTTLLSHAYRAGYDKISIESSDIRIQKEVVTITKDKLLGFEVVAKEQGKIVIENISEPSEKKYEVLLRRILFIMKDSFELLAQGVEAVSFDKLSEIKESKDEHERLTLFCKRVLSKERYEREPLASWELLTFLTHIQHALFYTYEYAQKEKPILSERTKKLTKDLVVYYSLFEHAFIHKDKESVHLINAQKKEYQFGTCLDELEKSKGKETVLLSYIREIFRLIQIATSPLLLILLEKH